MKAVFIHHSYRKYNSAVINITASLQLVTEVMLFLQKETAKPTTSSHSFRCTIRNPFIIPRTVAVASSCVR